MKSYYVLTGTTVQASSAPFSVTSSVPPSFEGWLTDEEAWDQFGFVLTTPDKAGAER